MFKLIVFKLKQRLIDLTALEEVRSHPRGEFRDRAARQT